MLRPRILRSPVAAARLAEATAWLEARGAAREVVIVAPSYEAASQLARAAAARVGAAFGWHRVTLPRLAGALAARALATSRRTPTGVLPLEALVARTFHRMHDVGRFRPIHDRPGLPRALARTLEELRLAAEGATLDADVARILAAYESELASAALADRADVLALAAARAHDPAPHELLAKPTLLLDVAVSNTRERDLVAALAARAEDLLVTVPSGDERTLAFLATALGASVEDAPSPDVTTSLGRLHAGLFAGTLATGVRGDDVVLFSAPGESRECVEIARRIRDEAERGTPFDRMAILLRAPAQYRTHVEEALRRAQIPAYFARGTVRPDPAGRAFLALLACAQENLSARRFAEYLSLGEVPDLPASGAPPDAPPSGDRFVPPDEETLRFPPLPPTEDDAQPTAPPDASDHARGGTLFAPRHWERLLVEAAVIGGPDRWARRLDALVRDLDKKRLEARDDEALLLAIDRNREGALALAAYALPLMRDLAALRQELRWGEWTERLGALATRALRSPARVLSVLAELAPMRDVGPVDLAEVRLALEARLTELVVPPSGRPAGKVFVGSADEARGLAFDVVFVPGLAEKMFPQKVSEDPILIDAVRSISPTSTLRTNADRAAAERLALRLAVGAATSRVFLSYPRLDLEQSRPRTPSFYALEVLRAAVGALPGFDELARHAESASGARVGWPAPARSADAIDEAEHDLALLERVMRKPESEAVGTAHFLLNANVHLARALRFRGRRWNVKAWKAADGLVDLEPRARAALAPHQLSARSYSPTALQNFAACPYKFVLQAIHRLGPREEPQAIEELDALQKGSLVHDTMFELYTQLRADGRLPVTPENLPHARARLDEALAKVAAEYEEKLAPAIPRVFSDELARIKADLRELLRRASESPEWKPSYFELAFGLAESRGGEDPRSRKEPVDLECGIRLRGSIDLVEAHAGGKHRATDYKTGKIRAKDGLVIAGGRTLQPVFYALAAEKLLAAEVWGGQLYYCTTVGRFTSVPVRLDDDAREAARLVARTIGGALEKGFLPAAPDQGECEWCDYRPVCGPHEERRTKKKDRKMLEPLFELRRSR